MKKTVFCFIFLPFTVFCFEPILSAQNIPTTNPFKGFHVGITRQMELVQKADFTPFYLDRTPIPLHGMGWEAGLEVSYHFARYFGFSIGLNFGTINAGRYKYYLRDGKYLGREDDSIVLEKFMETDMLLPIQFEFHYPLKRNFYFTASAGVKLKGWFGALTGGENYLYGYSFTHFMTYEDEESELAFTLNYVKDMSKVEVDILLSTGIYYRFPYADLLRLTVGANFALNNYASGYYDYPPLVNYPQHSAGIISMHNNFIGISV